MYHISYIIYHIYLYTYIHTCISYIYIYIFTCVFKHMQFGFAAHPWLKRKWEKTPPHEPLRGLMSKNMPMSHGANEMVADVCSWLCLPMRPTVSDLDYADYASLMAQDGSITSFKMRIEIQTSLSVEHFHMKW